MDYLNKHTFESITLAISIFSLAIAYFSLVVPIRQYLNQRNIEEKDKRFKNYHKLIEELVSLEKPKLHRQVAVVYELRNYSEYFEVTKRILAGLRKEWSKSNMNINELIEEIDLTLDFIEKN